MMVTGMLIYIMIQYNTVSRLILSILGTSLIDFADTNNSLNEEMIA